MKLDRLKIALVLLFTTGAYGADDFCFECHTVMEGTSVVFKDDVHYRNSLSCAACHGGDPKINDMNLSKLPETGFKLRVTREGTPAFCGHCHSDAAFMGKYVAQPRVDQLALYTNSVHGRQLAAGQSKSAQCVDCHGVHNIRAASDPLSPVSPRQVSSTCAKCHASEAQDFRASPHARRFTSARRPGCVACHASHAIQPAGIAMVTGKESGCARCHDAASEAGRAAAEIADFLAGLEAAGPESKPALDRARRAVHTASLAAVKRAAESTPPTSAPAGRNPSTRPGE
jgi:hypothetical protein